MAIACVVSPAATFQAETNADEEKLTTAEENWVYGTKSPSQRVKAFLKVADNKVEQVKRDVRSETSPDIGIHFRGYSTAIEGAWMAISWGRARGTDMSESARAIRRTTRRHAEVLQKLEPTIADSQRQALDQILNDVLRIDHLESNSLYAQR